MDEKFFNELLKHTNDDDKGLPMFVKEMSKNAKIDNFIAATEQVEACAQDEGLTNRQVAEIRVILAKAIISVAMVKQLNKLSNGDTQAQDIFCNIASSASMSELLKSVLAAVPVLIME